MEQESKEKLPVAEMSQCDKNNTLLPAVRKKYIPPAAGIGRKKGSKNKYTIAIKTMVETALQKAGGVEYLTRQADENPVAFMGLVGKLLPREVRGDVDIQFKGLTVHVVKSADN